MSNGLSIKEVRSQREGVCPVRTRGRGFFRSGRPQFLVQKASNFSKFLVCPHGQKGKGVDPVRIFCRQGEESMFLNFLRTSFMDGR